MIKIANLRFIKPKHPWEFKVDRSTPVGNPYEMKNEAERNLVCSQYDDWFHYAEHDKVFYDYVQKLFDAYVKYKKLSLFLLVCS